MQHLRQGRKLPDSAGWGVQDRSELQSYRRRGAVLADLAAIGAKRRDPEQVVLYGREAIPKPGYVADWPDLPKWQQETDADIFEAIEKTAS
ncbi:hypothetical protein [Streptomyces sp. G-G2]|uniref:hypothetical protein n=1 Tax=Streptomyces sp. G-G2 TaxID=3046201 RepID=UPI0024BAFC9D|nr:hypothetical protein [Streptomyces sp. G-G2]MDJ0384682.1 hypothetical protein [Streptomyces sp. G-G2]